MIHPITVSSLRLWRSDVNRDWRAYPLNGMRGRRYISDPQYLQNFTFTINYQPMTDTKRRGRTASMTLDVIVIIIMTPKAWARSK